MTKKKLRRSRMQSDNNLQHLHVVDEREMLSVGESNDKQCIHTAGQQQQTIMEEEKCKLSSHYSVTNSSVTIANDANAAFVEYNESYKDGWEFTFVGCCHDDYYGGFCTECKKDPVADNATGATVCSSSNCKSRATDDNDVENKGNGITSQSQSREESQRNNHPYSLKNANNHRPRQQCNILHQDSYNDRISSSNNDDAHTTQFNVTALIPSVRRLYVDLWDTIELSILGYYDAAADETTEIDMQMHYYPVPAIMRILCTFILPELMEYLYFVAGLFRPLSALRKVMQGGGADNSRREGGARAGTGAGATGRRRRTRDGGVMGPLLSRGLFPLGHSSSIIGGLSSFDNDAKKMGGISVSKDNDNNAVELELSHNLQATISTGNATTTTTLEEINSLCNAATNMSAWKLACFLRQRGVGCLRCSICDCIDLMGDDFEGEDGNEELRGISRNISHEETNNSNSFSGGRSPFLRNFQKQMCGGGAWMTPCQCPELVHRTCLERKLGLVPKYEPWEYVKLGFVRVRDVVLQLCASAGGGPRNHGFSTVPSSPLTDNDNDTPTREEKPIAPRVWISYDNTIPIRRTWHRHDAGAAGGNGLEEEYDIIAVDHLGQFCSPNTKCKTCGAKYLRTVRLPRSKWEVLAASLSDPLSMMRAASTFIHFILACAFLAACEGMCFDDSCTKYHRTLLTTPLGVLKWPTTGLNGFALAWWQLQQCCMLHIFFSQRFSAIVDRLWMGPISLFYCRLYFYFIVTSAVLAASYIPMVSRTIRTHVLEPFISPWMLESVFQPVGDAIALANLLQYAVVSTTVVCIFWRTHYRIFTVADGKEAATILQQRREEEELAVRIMHGAAAGHQGDARQNNINRVQNVVAAAHEDADLGVINVLPVMQQIVDVGADDNNAANHPIYHGPW